ncbi:OmpA family protein [Galbibacter mesophilus]|uniref:OmpA family protein n=1 Tax=Galbibacter mesophilus TaxID=379069 RepID=UPI00191CF921|nr:OmpA family protein [Galbibacter mesophilus]MCM5662155.1 OmpA family protein [Galbibacter mesophilus]
MLQNISLQKKSGARAFCLVLFSLSFISLSIAQDKKLKRANRAYNKFDYVKAINMYEGIADNGYQSAELYEKLGNAYYFTAEPEKAVDWYGKLMDSDASLTADDYYRYAQSLKARGDYTRANSVLEKLASVFPQDNRAALFRDNPNYLEDIYRDSVKLEVSPVIFNSPYSDFSPVISNAKVYFTSARDTGFLAKNMQSWNQKRFTDIYEVNLKGENKVNKLSKKINSRYNESTAIFLQNGNKIYFTRNNADNKKLLRGKEEVNSLQIYEAELNEEGVWESINKLPFGDLEYSIAHPAFSKDGETMVFASDMPGGKGKSDLYMVSINSDGAFSNPVSLGDKINTESRETFPYLSEGKLYFSSDGHPGLGGLDLFVADLDESFNVLSVKNLGFGINSPQDDFSITTFPKDTVGYFASNRDGGKGSDDIYAFSKNCLNSISGNIKNKEGEAISDVEVTFTFEDGTQQTQLTNSEGDYVLSNYFPCGEKVSVSLEKDGYVSIEETIKVEEEEQYSFTLELEDLHEHITFNEIYFAFDKSYIKSSAKEELNKVAQFLIENPKYNLEIASFTDSIGDENYNLGLSQRRANATVKYLISQGVEENRVKGIGKGEAQLAECFSEEPCDKSEKELNRRSEFKLLRN